MIISFEHKFAFVHVAKTAGDSITKALAKRAGRDSVVVANDFQAWRDGLLATHHKHLYRLDKHSPARSIKEVLGDDVWRDLYTFAFVREPIDRAVSLYTYIQWKALERKRIAARNLWYLTPKGRTGDPNTWPAMIAYLETRNFSDFIRHPATLRDQAMHSQTRMVYDENGKLLVDFVGRVESLETDMGTIAERLGLKHLRLPCLNRSPRRKHEVHITNEDREYLADLQQEDYRTFGYPRRGVTNA